MKLISIMKVKEFYTAKHILNFNLNLNYKIDLNYESKRVFNRKPAQQNPDEQVLATALLGILTKGTAIPLQQQRL